ncbi:Multidrug resistance protein stp [Roseivivax jejudonensis]|uniref:Multidrug resistance protein stp n=1 Tax=Roseivivax jejudonensis TaxID=1529041 RepID=A0A1X6YSU8_9RHOB|nr:MFS transporter [Roseivivax jejudonensis]SLN29678.1 Multidrug resistance protein stp [Roseivivax jejudonensis]
MTGPDTADRPDRASVSARRPVFDSGLCTERARPYLLVAAILASALGFIDGSVVAIALPAMRETLSATLGQAQWMANAYLLTLSSLILVGGALGDRFGVARVFGAGIALFVAASMVCAAAPTAGLLIAARAVQGIGAALMVPGSLALISRAYPREERGAAIGTWAAASALTTALGPVVGGAVLSAFGDTAWRWIFAVNLPLGGIALWLLWRHAQEGRTEDRPIDLVGAGLATLGLLLLAWGLSGAEHEGGTGGIRWGLAAAGLVVFAIFIAAQARVTAPMVPLGLFRSPVFAAANLLSFFLYFALTAMLFYLPMTLIAAWGVSPLAASAAFAPLSVFISALSPRVGRLADRIGPRAPIAGGSALVALAYGLLAASVPLQSYWFAVVPAMALAGLGMAFVVAPLSTAVMGAVDDAQSGTASGVNNAVTRVAGLIAVAVAGALAGAVYAASGGPASFGAAADGAAHRAATDAGFIAVAWTCAALSALSAGVAWAGLRPRP